MGSDELLDHEASSSKDSDNVTKSSRRARNDQKWCSLKAEIYRIYMMNDSTLQNTMRDIEEEHGFLASERKWKEKLKEWNFDKNISSFDMGVIVSKAEKRLREEGKETVFFHGETQITRERIEQFKRRKTNKEVWAASQSADTPKNITYHSPPPNSPEPTLLRAEKSGSPPVLDKAFASSSIQCSPSTIVSSFYTKSETPTLPVVLEAPSGSGSRDHWSSSSRTLKAYNSSETDGYDDSNEMPSQDMFDVFGDISEEENKKEISATPGTASSRKSHRQGSSKLIFADPPLLDNHLEYLTAGFSMNLALGVSEGGKITKGVLPQRSGVIRDATKGFFDLHPCADREVAFVTQTSIEANSNNSVVSVDSGSFSESENDMATVSSSTTDLDALEANLTKGLELRATDWSTESIFRDLVDDRMETPLEFCEKLWKSCPWFEREDRLETALLAFDLLHVGYTAELGAANKRTLSCLVNKAHVLRKKREFKNSEDLYRQAIAGFRTSRRKAAQLSCQLVLANFLQVLNRDSEALLILVEALIEHFDSTKTPQNRQRMMDLMDLIQTHHSKIETGRSLVGVTSSISRLKEIRTEWNGCPKYLDLCIELIQLGAHYSELELFDIADLCFDYSAVNQSLQMNSPSSIQLCRLCKERSLHCQRQGKLLESVEHLELAFDHLLSLRFQRLVEITDENEQNFVAILGLEQLLLNTKPPEVEGPGSGRSPEDLARWSAWSRAEAAFRMLQNDHRRAQQMPYASRNKDKDGRAIHKMNSSHPSSMFSSRSTSSRLGLTYSVGSASSIVSNSVFMVP